MSVEITKLIRQRGSIKSMLTRTVSFVNNAAENPDLDMLRLRLEKTEPLFDQFDTVQSQIESLQEVESDDSERDDFESQYFQIVVKIRGLLARDKSSPTVDVSNKQTFQGNHIKLPIIDLPTFNGQFDKYISFYESFTSLIDQNSTLTNIQKLLYLKSCLKGRAADTIECLELTSDNYAVAWELIKQRFENKRLIVQQHVRALFDLSFESKATHGLQLFVDAINRHLRALCSLGATSNDGDLTNSLLIHLFLSKLDNNLRKDWEKSLTSIEVPSMTHFMTFLVQQCNIKDAITHTIIDTETKNRFHPSKYNKVNSNNKMSSFIVRNQACAICRESHLLYQCNQFKSWTPQKRFTFVKKSNLCINCLRAYHDRDSCGYGGCKHCGEFHNTLLHFPKSPAPTTSNEPDVGAATGSVEHVNNFSSCNLRTPIDSITFLSTAVVDVINDPYDRVKARVLLDSGSMSNFVSEAFCQRIGALRRRCNMVVGGLDKGSNLRISHATTIELQSRTMQNEFKLECLIVPSISSNTPYINIDISSLVVPRDIQLSDDHFNHSAPVDILIGAQLFWDLLCSERIPSNWPTIHFQRTLLGWIVTGSIQTRSTPKRTTCNLSMDHLSRQLTQFWELEEVGLKNKPSLSLIDQACEKGYEDNTRRDETGRYVVHLPLRDDINALGDSYSAAHKRFLILEQKFRRQTNLQQSYKEFMREYLDLRHMSLVPVDNQRESYYIPHHAVFRTDSDKIRVVFDASCRTSNGASLNSILSVGPKLQTDLFDILIRFRQHRYVLVGDCVKMYRQISVEPSHRKLQKILWRFSEDQPIQTYELNTVTYGTICAPYLAIRTIQQLCKDQQEQFPLASTVALRDLYVDDLLTGHDNLQTLQTIRDQITNMFGTAGFTWHKWKSNHSSCLTSSETLDLSSFSEDTKTLGVCWNPATDMFTYKLNLKSPDVVTRRSILATIAQIFDPLGLLSPVIVIGKTFLQEVWKLKVSWDEPLDNELAYKWKEFISQLPLLSTLKIPRHVLHAHTTGIEMHGFCDASIFAYAACIYFRSIKADGTYSVHLLCSKTKVAPTKKITLPRLELCGAELLANLVAKVRQAITVKIVRFYYWCDSSITLSWILSESGDWQTFVANRVSRIQSLTNVSEWRHVASENNPADVATRGLRVHQLASSRTWWSGPPFLSESNDRWPSNKWEPILSVEAKPQRFIFLSTIDSSIDFERFSSYVRLVRAIAWCFRFSRYCRLPRTNRNYSSLTVEELDRSLLFIIRVAQSSAFAMDIAHLKRDKRVLASSKLTTLTPFLDESSILRVGGRLKNAAIAYDARHPILLPARHPFTKLLIDYEHKRLLHAGGQATLASLRQKYWPLSARSVVRRAIHQCVVCRRFAAIPMSQLMGNLPSERVTPSRPFSNCGLDFCGPFNAVDFRRRGNVSHKLYISIWVCLSTKASHLEVVTDLSTSAFMAAFSRFTSRRGLVSTIISDNATNFVGCNNDLQKLFSSEEMKSQLESHAIKGITWKFIPPRSPHFGGLHEAAVKSAKHHIKRVVGTQTLTYDEFITLAAHVEACLNSRPISCISNDPNDLTALTPGHFLIGAPLMCLPTRGTVVKPANLVHRWQLISHMMQHFWRQWQLEYLNLLQQRFKWRFRSPNIKIGDLVLVKEENTPPASWQLGRVTERHIGNDGVCRVVTLRTSRGVFKRALTRLVDLGVESSELEPSKGPVC